MDHLGALSGPASTGRSGQYFENVRKLTRFFQQAQGMGTYNIATAQDERIIKEVNDELSQNLDGVEVVFLDIKEIGTDKPVERSIMQQLSDLIAAKPDTKGIIISNLDLVVFDDPGTLTYLNFQREALFGLNMPILIWLSEDNVKRMTHEAIDLFTVKQQGIVEFQDILEFNTKPLFMERFDDKYLNSEDTQQLQVKIELLTRQLEEAEEKRYDKKRILNDIVIPLLDAYRSYAFVKELDKLYNLYKGEFDLKDPKHLEASILALDFLDNWHLAKQYSEQLLEIEKSIYGEYSTQLAYSLKFIANLNHKNGDPKAALEYSRTSLSIATRVYPASDPELISFYSDLANYLLEIGNYQEAISNLEIATNVFYQNEGLDVTVEIDLLFIRSKIYNSSNQFTKSLISIERAVLLGEVRYDSNNPILGNLYGVMAAAYRGLGLNSLALKFIDKSLVISKRIWGADTNHYAINIGNLGLVYNDLKDFQTAEKLCLEALAIQQRILSANHPDLAYTYSKLAVIFANKKKYVQAQEYLRLGINKLSHSFGHHHPVVKAWENDLKQIISRIPVKRADTKIGRNDPCFCGSGKKFKNCHGRGDGMPPELIGKV